MKMSVHGCLRGGTWSGRRITVECILRVVLDNSVVEANLAVIGLGKQIRSARSIWRSKSPSRASPRPTTNTG